MDQPWTHRQRPERLERRIEFADYESTRGFLERLNAFSESTARFPDISFGRTYVNLTVRVEIEDAPIGEEDHAFAASIDALIVVVD
jgi:4a-hydroxytetrahydrobiopterin dehydratase